MSLFSGISRFLYQKLWYYRFYVDNKVEKRQFCLVYDNKPHDEILSNDCIFVLTGKSALWGNTTTIHGGLADRLKGIASVFVACKEAGRNFRIAHTHPYRLDNYLVPNQYNWIVNPNSLVYNINAVTPHCQRHSSTDGQDEEKYQKWRMIKLMKGRKCVHFYSNAITIDDNEFRSCFNELFRPSPKVEVEINKNLEAIGGSYISLSFRFTHLLGDPVDTYMKELSSMEKELLITDLISCISDFHTKYPNQRILVNSDSNIFLSRIRNLNKEYIYIVPGVPVHIDQILNATDDSYVKTYVDFFLISKAEKVFLVKKSEMRNSGFPKCAAIIGNKPFEIVNI